MAGKIIRVAALVFILIFSTFVTASSFQVQKPQILNNSFSDAEMPIWSIGHYWKYSMDFIFITRENGDQKLKVDAEITNMYATVTRIDYLSGEEVYVLALDGSIDGVISLFAADIEVADFVGDLGGNASISTSTLGIKQFNFEVDGQVHIPIIGWRDMYFDMTMSFEPCFNFFDFPIDVNEEPWDVYIEDASIHVLVNIDIPFGQQEYTSSMVFNDVMKVNRTETINVPAGVFDTIVLSGTWGYLSNLFYAPSAGYLVKVDEGLNWDDGAVESIYHLNLLQTNYDAGNYPPNAPEKPYGPTQGEIENDYIYTTQTTDPNDDQIFYWFDWGDGTNSGWLGPYPSGSPVSKSHRWYDKGVYAITVKAKDTTGIESTWSEPLSVMITGDPKVTILMHYIGKKDEIDWDPIGTNSPEWYYMCHAKCDGTGSPPQYNYNTDDGTYNGNWVTSDTWSPETDHVFTVDSRYVTVKIKLMDFDGFWEGGSDDLADVSGCNYPDIDGYDDGTPDKRGAIYHGTYDLVTEELKPYNPNQEEYADFVYKQDGYYYTCGDYEPDNSIGYENAMKDPENDAEVHFRLTNDYQHPQAIAQIIDPPNMWRPFEELQFIGIVREGVPSYTWQWSFGDGDTSNEQNPVHTYDNLGSFRVTLTVTDGFDQVSSSFIDITIRNENPILTDDRVKFTGSGRLGDTFTFSVHYIDPDLDEPTVKEVYIDGDALNLNGAGSNSDYSLALKGSELGRGKHIFYFYFEDGHGGTAKSSEKSFNVKLSRTISIELSKLLSNFLNKFLFLLKIFDVLKL